MACYDFEPYTDTEALDVYKHNSKNKNTAMQEIRLLLKDTTRITVRIPSSFFFLPKLSSIFFLSSPQTHTRVTFFGSFLVYEAEKKTKGITQNRRGRFSFSIQKEETKETNEFTDSNSLQTEAHA